MLFPLDEFPPDASESAIPRATDAYALMAAVAPGFLRAAETAIERLINRVNDRGRATTFASAMLLGIGRIGHRHGRFGNDFHAYHNEEHALEILDRRVGRLIEVVGEDELDAEAWPTLGLFAACHDLRQRELMDSATRVGRNEMASVAETFRILACCGFCREHERALHLALELMIAGSTFDTTPTPHSPADAAAEAGPLAPQLTAMLDQALPVWRDDADIVRAHALAQIASDLDTANVGENFAHLCASSARLCIEREMRQNRSLDDPVSFQPVFDFLTKGQERYFFDLHRFCDPLGERAFAVEKKANTPKLRALVARLRQRFGSKNGHVGREVIAAHLEWSNASGLVV